MTDTPGKSNPSEKHEPKPPSINPGHRDQDLQKGAKEDDRPVGSNHPGLDDNGLPADEAKIAEDAEGARVDNSQG